MTAVPLPAGPFGRLVDGLFDNAALFPPGNAPMRDAVPAHRLLRRRLGELVGPFVVPATRLDELVAHLGVGAPFRVSVICPAVDLGSAVRRVALVEGLRLTAVELTPPGDAEAAHAAVDALGDALPAGVPAYVEVPRSAERDAVLDVLAGTPHRAKLRTGGLRAELFPAAAELAATMDACVRRGIPFKCTAGLHHAVRHTDPATGFEHHGFLNILRAADVLTGGGTTDDASAALASTDPGEVTEGLADWTAERVLRTREAFTSFGTCSVAEPVDDLRALGLLPRPAEARA